MKMALDANVVIYAIENEAALHNEALALFRRSHASSFELRISELVFLELLSRPGLTEAEAQYFYENIRHIATVNWPIDTKVLLKAAELRRKHASLKTPDAIHVATALVLGCDYFITNDIVLLKLKLSDIKLISLSGINRLSP